MKKLKSFFEGVFAFAKWFLIPLGAYLVLQLIICGITLIGTFFGL